MRLLKLLILVFCLCLTLSGGVFAQDESNEQLANLDLEELMDVEVVTASRRPEPLSQVAGAITVLNEEDIFRSGATNLAEALKLVPGVHVARMDTDKWAVGIRGFNGMLSNKHLVMVDGRPITSPTMAGVFWGKNLPISRVKRIEVVRGVWTSLWGSDSFTGVINVITKTAEESQGGQSVTTVGTTGVEETLRYGGQFGETGHAVGYGNVGYEAGNILTGDGGNKSSSHWNKQRGGVRVDWLNAYTDSLSFQGDISRSNINDGASGSGIVFKPKEVTHYSGYGQFVFDRATGLDAGLKLRTSFSRETESMGGLEGAVNIVDGEFQHAMEQLGAHRVTWGIGSRHYWDDMASTDSVSIRDSEHSKTTANSFVQDKITLLDERLYLILGLKLDYLGRGIEPQPTVRLLHTGDRQEFWMAVSRAVRTDNKLQRNGSYSIDHKGTIYTVNLPSDLNVEKLTAYEAGYRRAITETSRLDVNLYVNKYDSLIAFEINEAARTATLTNNLNGTAYGMEALLDWEAASWLRLRPSVSVIYQDVGGFSPLPSGESLPEEGLGSEIKLGVMTSPSDTVGIDVFAGYADSPNDRRLPGFFSLEGHVSWKATDSLMLELIGRNLGGGQKEYSRLKVGPSVDLRMTWDF